MANATKSYLHEENRPPTSLGGKTQLPYLRWYPQDWPGSPIGAADAEGLTCETNVEEAACLTGAAEEAAGMTRALDDVLADGRGLGLLDGRGCRMTVEMVVGRGVDCENGSAGAETEGAADAAALIDKELGRGCTDGGAETEGAADATALELGTALFTGSTPATKISFCAPAANPTSVLYPGLRASCGTGTLSPSS